MFPEFQESLLRDFLITDIDNKPEAPWIKRCQNEIVFTDNLLIFDSIDVLDTEEKERKGNHKPQPQPNKYIQKNIIMMNKSLRNHRLDTMEIQMKIRIKKKI